MMSRILTVCDAIRSVIISRAKSPELTLYLTPSRGYPAAGLGTDLVIGDVPLSCLIDVYHSMGGLDPYAVANTIHTCLHGQYSLNEVSKAARFAAPGIRWGGKGRIKQRLMQLAHAGARKGGDAWISAAGNRVRWTLGEWFVEFEGSAVRYGDKSLPFVRRLAPERTSWKSSLTATTGEFKRCRPRAASLRNALVQVLPDLVEEIDFFTGALAFSPKEATRDALKFFGVYEVLPSKEAGADPYWAQARGIVSKATQNPIKALVKHFEDQFEPDEVYRLFGQDPESKGGKFPDVVRAAFDDVLSELERGYIRTRAAESEDDEDDELDELMALQKLLT